ncbi:uncharacterized protein LOC141529324 [Cotesia typhae]|uniref:uncharacterized protein LOC141529324 n=1 Tax=Cotesia typhae TaxID=2053667 RepID=UPI003D69F839
MARIIKYLIDQKYLTLEELNERLRYFDYSEVDFGFNSNKISFISEKHISQGYIIITGAEMSSLVTYFGIIFGDCLPENDPVWKFYLVLFDLINVVTADYFDKHDLSLLQALIQTHNELHIKLFEGNLTAKFHILTHYPRIIKAMRPVKNLSCSQFESFKQKFRKYAHVVNSRVNIGYTLANKAQLELNYRFLSAEGFKNYVEIGQAIDSNLDIPKSSLYDISCTKVNGKVFRPGYAIYIRQNINDDPVFGIICRIITNQDQCIYFIYQESTSISLYNHVKGFLVTLPRANEKIQLMCYDPNSYIKPLKIHVTANGSNVITCRDFT